MFIFIDLFLQVLQVFTSKLPEDKEPKLKPVYFFHLRHEVREAIVKKEWSRILSGMGGRDSSEISDEEVQQVVEQLYTEDGWVDTPSLQKYVFPFFGLSQCF